MPRDLTHEVVPIPGERWCYHVRSRSGQPPYRVDLEAYDGNGECACKHFACRFAPDLVRGINRDWLRCYHILRARGLVLNAIMEASRRDPTFGQMLSRIVRLVWESVVNKVKGRSEYEEER